MTSKDHDTQSPGTTRADSDRPVVSVAIISDYLGGQTKAWGDLRKILAALARQDFGESAEYMLMENEDDLAGMPEDLPSLLPGLRIVPSTENGSYGLKNAAAHAARADLLMVIDADCIPGRSWVHAGVEAMRARPDAAAISGRTRYAGRTVLERALGLLSRAYVDRGDAAPVGLLSTNNVVFRRAALLEFPFPTNAGPFAYRLQSENILRNGAGLYFDPAINVVHDFEGWPMERDMRHQVGWASIRIRQLDRELPGASIVNFLGAASLPLFYAYRLTESVGHTLRLWRHYDLRWYQVPLSIALGAVVHGLELPGMLRAVNGRDTGVTVYR